MMHAKKFESKNAPFKQLAPAVRTTKGPHRKHDEKLTLEEKRIKTDESTTRYWNLISGNSILISEASIPISKNCVLTC